MANIGKSCQRLPKSDKSGQKFTKVKSLKIAKRWQKFPNDAKTWQNLPKSSEQFLKAAKRWQKSPKDAKMCPNLQNVP